MTITGTRSSSGQESGQRATARIFISHASEDRDAVDELYQRLVEAGYRPWVDRKDLLPGQNWEHAIAKALKESDFFIICLSEASYAKRGEVQREINQALKQAETKKPEDIYLIPVRLVDVEIPSEINRFQAVDLFADGGFQRLQIALAAQGFPGIEQKATSPRLRTQKVRSMRRPAFDRFLPCYLLDDSYHFLDWNPAFDEIVAKPLKLRRGGHAFDLVSRLANCQEVIERSKVVFGPGEDPLVDLEVLKLDSARYGLIEFQKLACQIPDTQGSVLAWSISLNIVKADQQTQLFEDIGARLDRELNWSRYAQAYDRLLLKFDQYHELLTTVVGLVQGSQRCIDLGAGTGNSTAELLRQDDSPKREREVWAVELNQDMVDLLRSNPQIRLDSLDLGDDDSVLDLESAYAMDTVGRVTILKEDINRLDDLTPEYFDAAVLLNVLYSVDDPRECLRQAHRLLKPGGVLALSTSHCDTDVDRLFAAMRTNLEEKRVFESMRSSYEAARQSHKRMSHRIHRDSKADIRNYLEETGFQIDRWLDDEYEGAVVVIRAIKHA